MEKAEIPSLMVKIQFQGYLCYLHFCDLAMSYQNFQMRFEILSSVDTSDALLIQIKSNSKLIAHVLNFLLFVGVLHLNNNGITSNSLSFSFFLFYRLYFQNM